MEEEDHNLERMKFRELWDKGSSNNIIWLRVVYIVRGEEVDDGNVSGAKYGSDNKIKDAVI